MMQAHLADKSSQVQLKEHNLWFNKDPSLAVLHLANSKINHLLTMKADLQLTLSTCPQTSTDGPQPIRGSHHPACLQRPSPALNPPQSLSLAEEIVYDSSLNHLDHLVTPAIPTGKPTTNAQGSPGSRPLGGVGDS
jgi:hypothetical protein